MSGEQRLTPPCSGIRLSCGMRDRDLRYSFSLDSTVSRVFVFRRAKCGVLFYTMRDGF